MSKIATIKLLKPHRHAGRDYKPGQTIRLAEHKAEWLISQEVAEAAPSTEAPAAHKPAAAPVTAKPKE